MTIKEWPRQFFLGPQLKVALAKDATRHSLFPGAKHNRGYRADQLKRRRRTVLVPNRPERCSGIAANQGFFVASSMRFAGRLSAPMVVFERRSESAKQDARRCFSILRTHCPDRSPVASDRSESASRVTEVDTRLEESAARLSELQTDAQQLKARTSNYILLTIGGCYLLLAWIAAGQSALCMCGWKNCFRSPSSA